jgi:hypothetical protein
MKKNETQKSSTTRNEKNIEIPIKKILKELTLREKYNDMVNFAEKIHKANEIKIKENKIKDQEITLLNDQIHKLIVNNYNLQESIKEKINLRKKYEKEQKEISEYCNNLKERYFNSEKVFNNYSSGINKLKINYNKTQSIYDNKIEEIMKENEKLNKRINDRIDFYTHQKNQIKETNAKIERLKKELNDQNQLMNNRNKTNTEKYKKLKEEYEELKKKLTFMEVDYYREKTLPSTNVSLTNDNKSLISLDKKNLNNKNVINDNFNDNNLLNQLNELSKKFNEISINSDMYSKKKTAVTQGKTSTKNKTITKSFY